MSESKDSLGDRMKVYEQASSARLMPLLPAMARLDGKAFHAFTRGLNRPYDDRMSQLMIDTTAYLVEETNACIGYTQSDEISLVWQQERYDSELFFGGKIAKMTSVLASMATWFFNAGVGERLAEKVGRAALFDCRVWNVPNRDEAVNTLIWREQDATRNSIQMAAFAQFSAGQMFGKSCDELQEMLWQKGINWSEYPAFFKRGTYVQRRKVSRPFTTDEIESLPPKHAARSNPNLAVERNLIGPVEMLPLARVENRVGVVFDGETPVAAAGKQEESHAYSDR